MEWKARAWTRVVWTRDLERMVRVWIRVLEWMARVWVRIMEWKARVWTRVLEWTRAWTRVWTRVLERTRVWTRDLVWTRVWTRDSERMVRVWTKDLERWCHHGCRREEVLTEKMAKWIWAKASLGIWARWVCLHHKRSTSLDSTARNQVAVSASKV